MAKIGLGRRDRKGWDTGFDRPGYGFIYAENSVG